MVLTLLLGAGSLSGASPFPVLKPTEPQDAHKTFELHPDFELTLVAAEPLVADPVAVAFEESGAIYVAEMRGYSERRDLEMGRIVRLIDTDGDGKADGSTILADGLQWPTGIHCFEEGVFVLAAPDLFYFKDTDNDGKADIKRLVLTGFSTQSSRLNVQQLPNSMRWGLDQKIHIAEGGNGSRIRRPNQDELEAIPVRRGTIVFDPFTESVEIVIGGGQFGMCYDDAGRRFLTSNSRHLMQVPFDRLPMSSKATKEAPAPSSLHGIAKDGDAAPVYRRSPEEGWRVLRTDWRVSGKSKGIIEGGGRSSGYFTGATGVCIYRGTSLEEDDRSWAYVADAGSNLIHRKPLELDGVLFRAERHPSERTTEFMASSDNWFRPVQIENGPGNAIYVLDMYREVIEHPWSLPPGIKEHIDLNRGHDRGRIWKVVHKSQRNFRSNVPERKEIIAQPKVLASLDSWSRETSARLLAEELYKLEAIPRRKALNDLTKFASNLASANARILFLSILDRFASRDDKLIEASIQSSSQDLRLVGAHQLFRSVSMRTSSVNPLSPTHNSRLWEKLLEGNEEILFHTALFMAGNPFGNETNWRLAERILLRKPSKELETAALYMISNLSGLPVEHAFSNLGHSPYDRAIQSKRLSKTPADQLIKTLAEQDNQQELLTRAAASAPYLTKTVLPTELRASLKAVIASSLIEEPNLSLNAILLLPKETATGLILEVIKDNPEQELLTAALGYAQPMFTEKEFHTQIVKSENWTPSLRNAFFLNSLRSPTQTQWLLDALERTPELTPLLTPLTKERLRGHRSLAIRSRAREVFGDASLKTLSQLQKLYQPALTLSGNAEKGAAHFQQRCATCHRGKPPFSNEGPGLGPDMVTVATAGRALLLGNILDPNREVAAQFEAWTIVTSNDGGEEEVVGLIEKESTNEVTIRSLTDIERKGRTISRSKIISMKPTGRSLMPEGLLTGMTPQDLADLFAFIESLR